MDADDLDMNGVDHKIDVADAFSAKGWIKKDINSDESDSDESDSGQEVNDIGEEEDGVGEEVLANPADEEMDEEDKAEDWEGHDLLRKYHHALTRGTLMRTVSRERLILDSGAGFILIDGDSLMLEVIGTKSWRYGQQLHLFYLIEMYLYQLQQNGGAAFEVVFFKEMGKIWYADLIMRVFRETLINHLSVNCKVKVHCQWEDPFCEEWMEYLSRENPSYIFVYDGVHQLPSVHIALKILSYQCLALSLDVAFTDNVKQQSSKLYPFIVKSIAPHSSARNKRFLQEAWTCLLGYFNTKFLEVPDGDRNSEISNFKEKLFLESLSFYWNDIRSEEKESCDSKHVLNRWCRYFAALSSCSLADRIAIARESGCHSYKNKIKPGNHLFKFAFCVLQSLCNVNGTSYDDPESVGDIIDLAIYHQLFESDTVCTVLASDEIEDRYLALHELAKSKGMHFETDQVKENSSSQAMVNGEDESTLITVESRLAKEYAGEVKSKLVAAERGALEMDVDDEDFDSIHNWKSGEPLKDDIDHYTQQSLSKIPFIRSRQLKQVQKYNDFLAMYGKSLENSIEPTVITKNENNKENKKTEKVQQKPKSKKQSNKKNMRETIIEENKKKLLEESKKKVAIQWKSKKSEIEETEDEALAIKKACDFIRKSESSKLDYEEPILYLLQLQYDRWKQSCVNNNRNMSYVADFVKTMHGILQSEGTLSDSMRGKIAKYFRRIGFEETAAHITQTAPGGKQHGNMTKLADKCPIELPYNVFQMKFMGHLLKRQERSDPDPRVIGFIPDTWQRELLDVVDKNESAVIVAPTSSGKTFCSFYCMEKVLREGDNGVVVYVSPTKALVNQVQATVYARYKKNMPAGMSVVGVFTRDYQHNALTSQILVTVPQCLEILLLSPKRQQWTSRLRYVIFDEVHCIGGETGGEVWEHLITLIRCPFLALSATIGNPEFFHSWLRYVNKFKELQGQKTGKNQTSMKYSVKLVVHNERYSDIKKNIYFPQNDKIVETHPCVFLDAHHLSSSGFPPALSMSPKEAYELWEASTVTFKDDAAKSTILEKWDPEKYFGDQLYITKPEAREYEVSLKAQLQEMLNEDMPKSLELISYFHEMLPDNSVMKSHDKGCLIPGISDVEFDIYKKFPAFIERLRKEDKLPVIVFMNNRKGIEMLSRSLALHVNRQMKEVRSKMSQGHAGKGTKKTGKPRKNRDSDGEEVEDHIGEFMQNEMKKQVLKIEKKENACKFITPGVLTSEDRDKTCKTVSSTVRAMLELGIGYHHAGCDAKHKGAVEILFRSQFAQVVTATATLALGIHVPCKTVVFVGDDHYVDALNYRQMSGRSGRRGFDNLGNVIFYGVPFPKISKLIKADISRLEGQFPVNCSIVLRLLLLVANASDDDDAHNKAMTVLSHPFITHQDQSLQNQLRYYFLFVTDFLIRNVLLDDTGIPLGFSGLVSHLHYHEPGNMVFVHLLKKGVFHDICKPSTASQPINYGVACRKCNVTPIVGNKFTCNKCAYDYSLCTKCYNSDARHRVRKDEHFKSDFHETEANLKYTYSEETLRFLVCILSHIFCVKEVLPIRLKIDADGNYVLRKKPSHASKVILDTLPVNISQALDAYNDSVQSIFGNYLKVVSKTLPKEDQVILPISQKSWKLCAGKVASLGLDDASAVDPFVQLSGCSNNDVRSHCLDTEEIRRILPRQIYMDFNFIPALSTGWPKNAFALDFFKHLSTTALLLDNWLQLGEIYDSLNDFRLLIRTISTALEQLGPDDTDDHVIWAFKHLQFEYTHRFNLAYPGRNRR